VVEELGRVQRGEPAVAEPLPQLLGVAGALPMLDLTRNQAQLDFSDRPGLTDLRRSAAQQATTSSGRSS
jgi:hypothetical protein